MIEFIPHLAVFIIDDIFYILAIAASVAGAAVSAQAQRTAAKQTELNAEAQNKALKMEQDRKEAELAENQKRLALQERRERASQFSSLASSGFIATTGTPLAIMADTVDAQQQRRSDLSMGAELDIWGLNVQGDTLMQEARSKASSLRSQAGATLLSGFGTAAGQGATLAGKYNKPKGDT